MSKKQQDAGAPCAAPEAAAMPEAAAASKRAAVPKKTAPKNKNLARLELAHAAGINICFVSSPGMGKTKCITRYCKERGITMVLKNLAQLEPCDMLGLMDPSSGEQVLPRWVRTLTEGQGGRTMLFLDEFNNAAPDTLAGFLNLLSDKAVDGRSIAATQIVLACNPVGDAPNAIELDKATRRRLAVFAWENDALDYFGPGYAGIVKVIEGAADKKGIAHLIDHNATITNDFIEKIEALRALGLGTGELTKWARAMVGSEYAAHKGVRQFIRWGAVEQRDWSDDLDGLFKQPVDEIDAYLDRLDDKYVWDEIICCFLEDNQDVLAHYILGDFFIENVAGQLGRLSMAKVAEVLGIDLAAVKADGDEDDDPDVGFGASMRRFYAGAGAAATQAGGKGGKAGSKGRAKKGAGAGAAVRP